jgi:hypothetical protein
MRFDHPLAALPRDSGIIGAQALEEQLVILCVEHRSKLGVQPGRNRSRRPDPSGALLD